MMILAMQILVVLGIGMVIYAVFEIFKPQKDKPAKKNKSESQLPSFEDSDEGQNTQRLQSQIARLEDQLEESKIVPPEEQPGLMAVKEKEAEFSAELKRREEWVAKAEAELAKVKAENLDLNNKFIAKENELQEEFTKNVNLTRQIREIKTALDTKEVACRLKEDQLQEQKHQIESQLKSINEYLATIAEFNRKEKISEWVPKLEFNQLNEEYTKLEKDLEVSQEKLKNFAAEIAHLRQAVDMKVSPVEEAKLPETISEEIKQEKPAPEEIKSKESTPEEAKQEGIKLEEDKTAEESGPVEKIKNAEEDIEKKIKKTEEQQ